MPRPSRRQFFTSLGTAAIGPVVLGRRAFAQNPPARVDAAALQQRIEALSRFGRPSSGTFADGVSRVAYSDADVGGRRYVTDLMRAAGLEPRVDAAGNIFGRRAGTDTTLSPILFGSHIDSVPNGGNFDGDLGSLAALGVLETLAAAGLRTRHPLEMVVWANEEGVAFNLVLAGSRVVAGDKVDLNQVWNGVARADAIRRIGGDPSRILDAIRPKDGGRTLRVPAHPLESLP
jgi:beta-ureidopropionase / N-carbamoyl-L-amino-acid hydrolase